jgi:hypothetical protein
MTVFQRLNPLPLDAPGAKTLVVGIVPREVAVFDQSADDVAACKVNGLVLAHIESKAIRTESFIFPEVVRM